MKYPRDKCPRQIAKEEGKSIQWVYRNLEPEKFPEFDEEGYPTDATLEKIRTWPISSNYQILQLLSYVERAWRYDFQISTGGRGCGRWFVVATSGWSGNESIIDALQGNPMFWAFCWLESRRGGGYKFLKAPIK